MFGTSDLAHDVFAGIFGQIQVNQDQARMCGFSDEEGLDLLAPSPDIGTRAPARWSI